MFDVVLGNPPYQKSGKGRAEKLWTKFIAQGSDISKNGYLLMITPNSWLAGSKNIKKEKGKIKTRASKNNHHMCRQPLLTPADTAFAQEAPSGLPRVWAVRHMNLRCIIACSRICCPGAETVSGTRKAGSKHNSSTANVHRLLLSNSGSLVGNKEVALSQHAVRAES